jgi:hypothetical protein
MINCDSTDFMYPMCAEIYTPNIEQGAYGNISKEWVLDRNIACSFTPAGSAFKEEIKPNIDLTQDSLLVGRAKKDLRISSLDKMSAATNVIVTNIKDQSGNLVYVETSGTRVGKSTIFEVATIQPFVGPFGSVEHYKIVLRRSENQAANV